MAIVSAREDVGNFVDSKHCCDHLRPFLQWMLDRHRERGGVTEVRLLQNQPVKAIYSGYFDRDHLDDLIELLSLSERARAERARASLRVVCGKRLVRSGAPPSPEADASNELPLGEG